MASINSGTKIHWNGNKANDPKSGVVSKVDGSMVHVIWENGTAQSFPEFVVKGFGWRIG